MKLWNPKEKKEKKKIVGKPHLLRQVEVAQKKKIVIIKRRCGQFCPNIFVQLSLSFSLQFGEIVFWRGRRENWWVPPKSLLFSTLNQTTKNIIFSPLFSPSFSILPKITPNKHSLRVVIFLVPLIFFWRWHSWCLSQHNWITFNDGWLEVGTLVLCYVPAVGEPRWDRHPPPPAGPYLKKIVYIYIYIYIVELF